MDQSFSKKAYVGGVSEEQRSDQERRFEELGLEEFYWSFIRLQARVDDLETELAALKALKSERSVE